MEEKAIDFPTKRTKHLYLGEAAIPSLRYHRVESGRVSNEGEPWIWLRPSIRCLYVGTIPFIIIIYYRGLRERGRAPLLTRNRGCSRHTRRILSRSLPEAALPGIVLEFNSPPTRRRFRFPPRSFGFGRFWSVHFERKRKKKKENFSSPSVCLPKFDAQSWNIGKPKKEDYLSEHKLFRISDFIIIDNFLTSSWYK